MIIPLYIEPNFQGKSPIIINSSGYNFWWLSRKGYSFLGQERIRIPLAPYFHHKLKLHYIKYAKIWYCRDPSTWWHVARSPIRTPSGRSTRHSATSRPGDSMSYPDMLSGSLTEVSKPCYVIPTACHSPRYAACRAKGQERLQVASHDLWQPPVG